MNIIIIIYNMWCREGHWLLRMFICDNEGLETLNRKGKKKKKKKSKDWLVYLQIM